MSETTRVYLRSFWTLVDEILNAFLFLLLGLQLLVVPLDIRLAGLGAAAVVLVLLARLLVVLRLQGLFQLPLALFIGAMVVVAETTLSTER